MSSNVPRRYADVSAEWVAKALQNRWPEVTVSNVRRGPTFGYKQNKFRISLEYGAGDAGLAATYIVKGNFPDEGDPSTGTGWAMANELRSLRDIAPLVAAPDGPAWYHIDVTDEASAMIMEDLAPQGARFFDAHHTLDLGAATAFIDAFARLHASTWNSAMFAPDGVMGPGSFAHENRRLVNEVYFPTFFEPVSWDAYIELPRGRALPRAFQNLGRARAAWHAMWAVLKTSPLAVIHGDEHLGNLYLTADGQPGVIDWAARPEHWPIGISYFMMCALDIEDRRNWERALLTLYVSRLATYGAVNPPSFDEAWFLYRCASFYPVMTWLNNSAVWQPEAVNTANVVRAAVGATDLDAFRLLGV